VHHDAVFGDYYVYYFHDDGYETSSVDDKRAHQTELAKKGFGGAYTTQHRTPIIAEAYDEQVKIKDAWTEQVKVSEGYWE
jgi:hypothetical protein